MKKFTRLTALLLALMMIFSTVAASEGYPVDGMTQDAWNQIVTQAKDKLFFEKEGGKPVELPAPSAPENKPYYNTCNVLLSEGSWAMSTADLVIVESDVAGQWQIAIDETRNDEGEEVYLWADIAGENSATLNVNAAMLANVPHQVIRQVVYDENDIATQVGMMSFSVSEPQAVMALAASARDVAAIAAADEPLTVEEANEGKMVIIEVRYQISATQSAAASYVARIGYGSKLNTDLTLPRQVGYLATSYKVEPSADLVSAFTAQTINADGSISLAVTAEQSTQNYIITVQYEPTDVAYTVKHYLQNANDDGYTLDANATETKYGKTGTQIGAGLYKDYEGFTGLWYDSTVEIAADGKTEISIYYDREYYLMGFVLGEGGYGVDPIYARYGAPISVGTPSRPGYTFHGWSETPVEQAGPGVAPTYTKVTPDSTMPLGGKTYYAVWTMNEKSTVTIVFWGENANDEDVSPLGSVQVTANVGSSINYEQMVTDCGNSAHQHDADCYDCGTIEHEHTDSCCSLTEHVHERDCYTVTGGSLNTTAASATEMSYLQNTTAGTNGVYRINYYGSYRYYVKIGEDYYRINNYNANNFSMTIVCTETAHTHGTGCSYVCGLNEHTHASCDLECTVTEHTHTARCYDDLPSIIDPALWTLVESDTATVLPDGTTALNVRFDRTEFTIEFREASRYSNQRTLLDSITDKWGASIVDRFEAISDAHTYMWSNDANQASGPWTSYLEIMPSQNVTYYAYYTNSSTLQIATYLGQEIGSNEYTLELYVTKVYYGQSLSITKEEFIEIEGFTYAGGVNGSGTALPTTVPTSDSYEGGTFNNSKFYYRRNTYNIEFRDSYNKDVVHKTVAGVPYEQQLSVVKDDDGNLIKDYVLTKADIPAGQEPGSLEFAGWYLNPECTGDEYKIADHTMPVGAEGNNTTSLVLYAKWVPATHTVNYYLTEDDMTAGTNLLETENVTHGNYATAVADPENGGYTFAGWYYIDEAGNEMRFDHNSMTIRRDMDIYAKWTATDPVTFTFYYKDEQGNEIASPLQGQALPGQTVTKNAKVGEDLDLLPEDADPLSYIPDSSSKSIEIDFDSDKNVITFVYATGKSVDYTIQYIEATIVDGEWVPVMENGDYKRLLDDDELTTTRAVETANYKPVLGFMPQTTQIRLVLSADDPTKNVIQFLYVENKTDALYNISHYKVDHNGNESLERKEENIPGKIDDVVTATWLTNIEGYKYNAELTRVEVTYQKDGEWVTETVTPEHLTVAGKENTVGHTLPEGGLHFKLYYTPINYPYIVYHVDEDGNKLAEPDTGTAPYGSTVTPTAKDITNYVVESIVPGSVVIKIETGDTPANNVMTITYRLDVSTLKITKTVIDAANRKAPDDDKFTIQVKFTFADGAAKPSKYILNNDTTPVDIVWADADKTVATFTDVKADDVIVIQNVVIGTTYTVAETAGADHYDWEVQYPDSGNTHAVVASGNEVVVKNTYLTGTLTINKTVSGTPDNESFIFKVEGPSFDGYVTIKNGGSVTLSNLVLGTYTVTETNWSYRYTPDSTDPKSAELSKADPNGEVTFNNTEKDEKWLHDEANIHNDFSQNTSSN